MTTTAIIVLISLYLVTGFCIAVVIIEDTGDWGIIEWGMFICAILLWILIVWGLGLSYIHDIATSLVEDRNH